MSGLRNTKNSIRLRLQKEADDSHVFKTIITHPMETGIRRDNKTGQLIPADYIDVFRVLVDGLECFAIKLGPDISKNPFLSFMFTRPLQDNQILRVEWTDNRAEQVFYESRIRIDANGRYNFESTDKATVIPQLVPETGPACATKHRNPQQ